ncbi:prepilin-type N-terminal cleavage/methylation domain-containing protein [Marinicella sediminis]|uniref:Prepilin-type N-terminal cleavage/methylation domain-containing protein n=1 Tax=Marinicella sediminis TaxID=1792834 RepID=A0ABV7JCL2_9GAMM|nr:prepilin-type N-terminal cleavage/methylation domain-containing protein [Marinicella sediminis]
MKRNQQGFTLIELMIVIAIIAILMAYALPAYRDYTVRTKLGEGNAMAAGYKMAINEAYVRTGDLAGLTNDANGIGSVDQVGQCVSTLTVTDGVIAIAYDCLAGSAGEDDADVAAASVTWTPTVSASGTLQWTCTSTVNRPAQDPC